MQKVNIMHPKISNYINIESDEIDSPNSQIIRTKSVEGRSVHSYLPVSYDGTMNKYFKDMAGHELGGPSTILWLSNLCMQMGKFYAPGLVTKLENTQINISNSSDAPTNFKEKFFEIKRPSFLITPHRAGHNFFHFLIDSLPHIKFKENFLPFSKPILFSESREAFQKNTMGVLLRRKHPIYDMSHRVLMRECAITWPLTRTAAVDFLRKRSARVAPDTDAKRIYVSRRNSVYRKIINEIELEPILYRLGFKIIECESVAFDKQISLFKAAEIVCGPHGAGLANIAFCQKNASVLEIIMEERLSTNVGSAFWELACAADLDYHMMSGRRIPIDEKNKVDGAMYVDPQKFEDALYYLIDSRK